MEKVSIIIPVYNHEKFVTQAIESAVSQTYPAVEIIVIDDGSKDNSAAVIRQLQQKHGFTFVSRPNKGVCATLNEGISLSTGTYIAFMASDDFYAPEKIAVQVAYMHQNPARAMCCSLAYTAGNDGQVQNRIIGDIEPDSLTFQGLLRGNAIVALTAMIRKDVLNRVGLFDEQLKVEDWDMWLRIAHDGEIGYINTPLAYYRIHESNTSSQDLLMAVQRVKIMDKWLQEEGVKALREKIIRDSLVHFAKAGRKEYLLFAEALPECRQKPYWRSSYLTFLANAPTAWAKKQAKKLLGK